LRKGRLDVGELTLQAEFLVVEAVKPLVVFLGAELTSVLVKERDVLDAAIASAIALVVACSLVATSMWSTSPSSVRFPHMHLVFGW